MQNMLYFLTQRRRKRQNIRKEGLGLDKQNKSRCLVDQSKTGLVRVLKYLNLSLALPLYS
jgi:hypothetical protein